MEGRGLGGRLSERTCAFGGVGFGRGVGGSVRSGDCVEFHLTVLVLVAICRRGACIKLGLEEVRIGRARLRIRGDILRDIFLRIFPKQSIRSSRYR